MTSNEIIQGDCRDLIPTITEQVHCILTDPPYGVNFKSFKAETPQGRKFTERLTNDEGFDVAIPLFLDAMTLLSSKTGDQAEMYVFTKWDIIVEWTGAVRDLVPLGWKHMMNLIWAKGYPGLGDLDGNWGCGYEIIMYLKKGRRQRTTPRQSGIIHVDKLGPSEHIHPTEKPVPLIERLLEFSTSPNDLVVDPFSGSGSTAVAAQNLGRNSIGFEIMSEYVEKSRKRLAQVSFF